MTRERGITCLEDIITSALPRFYLPISFFQVHAMLLLPVLFFATPAYAEEAKVFTDADLVNYNAGPMVDQETASRVEDDLKSYEKKSDAEFLLYREKRQRQQTEAAKRVVLQKQEAEASRATVSNQGSDRRSGVPYVVPPSSKRRT